MWKSNFMFLMHVNDSKLESCLAFIHFSFISFETLCGEPSTPSGSIKDINVMGLAKTLF